VVASDKAYKNARRFRRELSLPEKLLWVRIRRGELHFRRQHPIGDYVLDFYCPAAKLAIEVDGAFHDRGARDIARDSRMAALGYATLRVPAAAILKDLESVLRHIVAVADARPLAFGR